MAPRWTIEFTTMIQKFGVTIFFHKKIKLANTTWTLEHRANVCWFADFRICRWVLPVVPGGSDPGQPGPANGLDPDCRSGGFGHWVFPEAFCCCESAGHTKRNPPAGQRTSFCPFLFVLLQAGVVLRVESGLRKPECFIVLKMPVQH